MDLTPSNSQGYGRISLTNSLFLAGGGGAVGLLAKEGSPLMQGQGQRFCFAATPSAGLDIRITLAW